MYFERFLQAVYTALTTDNYVGALIGLATMALWLLLALAYRKTSRTSELVAVVALVLATTCVALTWKGYIVLSGASPLSAVDVSVVTMAIGATITLASMAHTATAFALSPVIKWAARLNAEYRFI